MDDVKKHGGVREGAGRKPKVDEVRIIEAMDAAGATPDIWAKLHEKALSGNTDAIKTWLAYYYGMPKQKVETDVDFVGQPMFGNNPLQSL